MKIDKIIVGPLKTNCYVISIGNDCLVIDPGDNIELINKAINNKNILAVLITHSHFDHIGALKYFNKNIIYDINNLKEKEYNIGNFNFEVIYTKGHKEDSITFYFRKENIMFTGDFIFKGAIGRTDLEGGNPKEMLNSLQKIKKYDKNIVVYPGHGEDTILKYEL